MNRSSRILAAWTLVLTSAVAQAEMATIRIGEAPKAGPTAAAQTVRAKPPTGYVIETKTAPTIDGKLDDEAWKKARVLQLARTLDGGANAPQPTAVRCLQDGKNLYVAFDVTEPLMNRVKAEKVGRDGDVWTHDSVEVFIGPGDTYYHFSVNALGSVYDGQGKNAGWNCPGLAVAADKQATSWTVEMAIPIKAIAGADTAKELKANFVRGRRATGELQESAWSPTFSDDSHQPGRFGTLVFGEPPAPTEAAPKEVVEKKAVTIIPTKEGEGVVKFDLSILPKGAKVVRADLLVFRSAVVTGAADAANVDIQIYPLFEPVKAGAASAVAGKPLALKGPWFDRFDATDAVSQWAAGKTNGGFYFMTCPLWNAEGTCLDIAYEGKPAAEPPKQVAGVKAFHRAGQTFITWNEVDPLVKADTLTYGDYKRALAGAKDAVVYRVYASDKPIDGRSIASAELLGEVRPLSIYNVNARNKEYLIGQAMVESDAMGELAEDFNGAMHRWTPDSVRMDRYPLARFVIDEQAGPLPPGSGLYVHNPSKAGKSFFAVVACKNGVENDADFAANVAGPVDESVGVGEPVKQGKGIWGPYFDYPGTRWAYVQWCAPPLAPAPNMVFNWSVLVPPNAGDAAKPTVPGMEARAKVPAELYFHAAGYSYAQPSKKMLLYSVQIAPHDWPNSGWYGFNDAYGTLKSFKQGKVANHTQRRIVAFLDWAKKVLPIDPEQVICAGADGAASLALNYPDMFAYVWITGFDSSVLDAKAEGHYAAVWGVKSAEITDDKGRANWEWAELDKLALAVKGDLPLFACLGASWGVDKGYAKGEGRFYRAMQEARQPLCACWGWNGASNLGSVGKYDGFWRGHLPTRQTPVPSVWNPAWNHGSEQSGSAGLGGANWKDLVDTPEKFSVTIVGGKGKFNLTPRRLAKFKPAPGTTLKWEAVSLPGRAATLAEPQSGTVKVGPNGEINLENLDIGADALGLMVTVTKNK